jgi:deoxyribodipyrimidine photo-lyase
MVDAGMRQLWQTGTMHNRVRMLVGSFLVKNLLVDWRQGERWFWDCLLDADLAANSASWQWVAGTGADAAPYFRIFNPMTQGEKFDKSGDYVREYCPELAGLPDKYIHAPWDAPQAILSHAKIVLGHTYPKPIVDLKASRQRALDALQQNKAIMSQS